ncbi:MAG: nucleotidyltransferase domain-containing protein [Nanoarchaeota archaeon]|nr:nucleotidyltransferase domain-containing protein [Nanoarchaeota archaeon]
MNINNLLSTAERVRILRHIIYKEEPFGVNKTAEELNLSKGLVSKVFNALLKENLLKKEGAKFVLQDNLNVKSLRLFLNLSFLDVSVFKKYAFVKAAGLYGSFVKGENKGDSDIDLWVLIKKTSEESLAQLTSELRKNYSNIKPLYLTKEKLEILKKEEALFFHAIVFGSITLYGEKIENT